MSPPSLSDFLAALLVIEQFLMTKLGDLKERFPAYATDLDKLAEYLRVNGRTLETLALVSRELQVLSAGEGPVEHDDADLA